MQFVQISILLYWKQLVKSTILFATANFNPVNGGCYPLGLSYAVLVKVALLLRLVAVWGIPVQPFANVVGDYTCAAVRFPFSTVQKIFSGTTESPRQKTIQALEKVLRQSQEICIISKKVIELFVFVLQSA